MNIETQESPRCPDDLECHQCGKIGTGRVMIWLAHLCQHFVALCPECLKRLKVALGPETEKWARAIRNVQRALERNENRELNMGEAWALIKEAVAFELTK